MVGGHAISRLFRGTRRHCPAQALRAAGHEGLEAHRRDGDAAEAVADTSCTYKNTRLALATSRILQCKKSLLRRQGQGPINEEAEESREKPMDPMAMMDGMKGNMLYMVLSEASRGLSEKPCHLHEFDLHLTMS